MRKTVFAGAITAGLVLMSGCSEDGGERAKIDAQVTETRMDDIDKIEGTINDDMINIDESNEAVPLAKNDGKLGNRNTGSDDSGEDDQ